MTDKYGNTLTVKDKILMLQPIEGKPRNIGKIIETEIGKIYEKYEREADTFRVMDAWSVNYNALMMSDWIHFKSETRDYWIDSKTARMKGKFLKLRNAEEKIYIAKEHWSPYPPAEMADKDNSLQQKLGNSWYYQLKDFFETESMVKLNEFLADQYQRFTVYPEPENMFKTFKLCSWEKLRVVILGQDPYHDGQATGCAFETKGKMNPSVIKILKGMESDLRIGEFIERRHRLSYMCPKGIMLLNASLTVRAGAPQSHAAQWKDFTVGLLNHLNSHSPIVYLLWGKPAQSYKKYISEKHVILEAEHPSYAARQGRDWEHHNCFSTAREIIYKWYGEHLIW